MHNSFPNELFARCRRRRRRCCSVGIVLGTFLRRSSIIFVSSVGPLWANFASFGQFFLNHWATFCWTKKAQKLSFWTSQSKLTNRKGVNIWS